MVSKPETDQPISGLDRRPGWASWVQAQWQGPSISKGARLLLPLAWVYATLAETNRCLYTKGWRQRHRAPRPLLVVGNLIAGGAGKTPTVLALIDLLRSQGWTPGVISRGHGRSNAQVAEVHRQSQVADVGDEPLLIHMRTGVPVVVGRDRVQAARMLCSNYPEVDILVADDGLQHHRLIHDMSVWVFDDRGIGNGLCLPAGPLRQSLPARVPPNALVLYTAGRASTTLPGYLGARNLGGLVSLQDWWARHQQAQADGKPNVLTQLASGDQTIWAAAGLARPEPFFEMLEAQGLKLHRLQLPDHHNFTKMPWPADAQNVVVTEKDAVKLQPGHMGNTHVWVARLDFHIEPAFSEALRILTAPFKS
jgi:tetraacyldisaccharide 4'-kinase